MTDNKAVARQIVIRFAIFFSFNALCLFGAAGTLHWWNGWAFMAYMAALAVLTGTFFTNSTDLAEERMTARKKAKSWDAVLVPLIAVVLPTLGIILAGLDRRYGWTTAITTTVSLIALVPMIAGTVLTFWAMKTNAFFSSHVRIQTDRGHTVVSDGPYRFVRHPGYAGAIVYNLALPVMLGSLVAFWTGLAILVLSTVRIVLEERTLRAELPGYREYAERVHYRLLPGLW